MYPTKGREDVGRLIAAGRPLLREEKVVATDVDDVSLQKEGRCWAIHHRWFSSFFERHTFPPPTLPVSHAKEMRNAG